MTPSEHLFCEDELLEWLTRSNLCPSTNTPLDPSSIRRPSRIVLNMLAELQRYCPYRCDGCTWTGENEHCATHAQSCHFRPRAQLLDELKRATEKNERLKEKLLKAERRSELLAASNADLHANCQVLERKLRVYTAFLEVDSVDGAVGEDTRSTKAFIGSAPGDKGSGGAAVLSSAAGSKSDTSTSHMQQDQLHQLSQRQQSALERVAKEARDASVMERLERLRVLHGTLAELSLSEESREPNTHTQTLVHGLECKPEANDGKRDTESKQSKRESS